MSVGMCVCVFVCFCTAVSDDFSYFAKSFLHFAFWAALLAQTKPPAAAKLSLGMCKLCAVNNINLYDVY